MQRSQSFRVRASGPQACFTRPELRVERVSYEVMTPSAARGVLDAILWKPAVVWRIERIHVLNPIRFIAIKRNEVNSVASLRGNPRRYFADEDRAQRNTLMLRDVDYVIEAHLELTDRCGPEDSLRKFEEMFTRRLSKGQCFHTPYLGCREMVASVSPAPEVWSCPEELQGEKDLGVMLLDLAYQNRTRHEDLVATPRFFHARLQNGVLFVPEVAP